MYAPRFVLSVLAVEKQACYRHGGRLVLPDSVATTDMQTEVLPVGIEQDPQIPQELTLPNIVYAKVYAGLLRTWPDLISVVCSWGHLTTEARTQILAIIQNCRKQG